MICASLSGLASQQCSSHTVSPLDASMILTYKLFHDSLTYMDGNVLMRNSLQERTL
jgi:hypothetical protein